MALNHLYGVNSRLKGEGILAPSSLSLENTRSLYELIGKPLDRIPTIHVGGTNGKVALSSLSLSHTLSLSLTLTLTLSLSLSLSLSHSRSFSLFIYNSDFLSLYFGCLYSSLSPYLLAYTNS